MRVNRTIWPAALLWVLVVSTGAPAEEYGPNGVHHYPFEELIRPFEQMARFCGMRFLPPRVLHGGYSLSQEVIDAHAADYRRFLEEYQPTNISLE